MSQSRILFLLTIWALQFQAAAQAPFWESARSVTGASEVRCNKVQAMDGGCFVTVGGYGSVYLQNDTLAGSNFMVFCNASGELRSGIAMSEPRQLRDVGNGRVAFVSEVDGSFQIGVNAYLSEMGVGLITGTMDTTGAVADVLSMPNLIMGFGEHRVIDVHQGPSGSLFVLGAFMDSIAIADTMLLGSGTFLARFTNMGELIRADHYAIYPYNDRGAVVEGFDGTVYVALVQSNDHPLSVLGEGLLLTALAPDGSILDVYDNGNGSFYPDGHPRLAADPGNGAYLAYSRYNGFNDGASINVLRFAATGDLHWENSMAFPVNAFGDASPLHLEATDFGGVLVSGYSTAPLTMPGLDYMQPGPNCVVYELGADNELRWAIADNAGNVFGASASMDHSGVVYAVGWVEIPVQFGTHVLQNAPHYVTGYINKIGFGPDGISDRLEKPIGIHPNPTHDHFRVTLPQPSANWVQLIDQQGRIVHEEETRGVQVDLDVTGIMPGSYVVRSGSSVGHLIIQ